MLISSVNIIQKKTQTENPHESTYIRLSNKLLNTPDAVKSYLDVNLTIVFSVRLQHSIHYFDEANSRSRAKPAGVHGCEIWMKLGGSAPVEASKLTYLTTDTRTPYIVTFDGIDAGKTVYYWLRWVNTRSEHGPWSSAISAMVVG